MPTSGGPRDAISVPSDVGDQLNAAYSFMVQMIIISFWGLLILAGVTLYLGKEKHSHNSGVISTGIWNSKGSPLDVLRITLDTGVRLLSRQLRNPHQGRTVYHH